MIQYNTFVRCQTLIIRVLIGAFILLPFYSCSKKLQDNSSPISNKENRIPRFEKEQIKVLVDGNYVEVDVETFPEPKQSKDQFYKDMYMGLRYPAAARENNVQGSVLFEITIDELGNVINIHKVKSLSPECDEQAFQAIRRGCANGFEPYIYKKSIVNVKYYIPVNFRLE